MDDTSPEMQEKIHEMMMKKAPSERMQIGCSLNEIARFLATRSILENNPEISAAGLRKELFLKFYGDDFDEKAKVEILKYLEGSTEQKPNC